MSTGPHFNKAHERRAYMAQHLIREIELRQQAKEFVIPDRVHVPRPKPVVIAKAEPAEVYRPGTAIKEKNGHFVPLKFTPEERRLRKQQDQLPETAPLFKSGPTRRQNRER